MSLLGRIYKNRMAYVFILPILLLLGAIKYYAFFLAVLESMFEWNGANVNNFIGLGNFIEVFKDGSFYAALKNIIIIAVFTVLINVSTPLLTAELVFNLKNRRLQNFFKVGFIVPMVVPMMVIILLWKWMYASDYGVINQVLKVTGLGSMTRPWLGDTGTALGSMIFMNFPWIAGLPFLLFLAGLQGISADLFEVAVLDGVNRFKRFVYIDLPLISSQIKIVIMFVMINSFQLFEAPYVLTNGGPGTSTLTPALYMYQQAFNYSRFGFASTIGVVLFILVLILTAANQKFFKGTETID